MKKTWDILEKSLGGVDKLKEVKLYTHKIIYDLLQMGENKNIANFFTRVTRLVNHIKICEEVITSRSLVAKILRSLIPNFDHVVVSIEESKNLSSLKNEELQGTLESRLLRMIEIYACKSKSDVAL